MGSKILEFYSDEGISARVINIAFPDRYIEQGTQKELFSRYKLDAEGIFCTVKEKMGEYYGG